MESAISKKDMILRTSVRLFLEQGYYKTSMRQIAAEADVSLGLVEYHFGNKRNLAFAYLQNLLMQLPRYTNQYFAESSDPVLHSCVIMRFYNRILCSPNYVNFYKDMLDADILLEAIMQSGTKTIDAIMKIYDNGMNEADALFYGNCLGPSVERALMHFPQLHELSDDIPDIIFKAFIQFVVPDRAHIERVCVRAKLIVDQIMRDHPELMKLDYLVSV